MKKLVAGLAHDDSSRRFYLTASLPMLISNLMSIPTGKRRFRKIFQGWLRHSSELMTFVGEDFNWSIPKCKHSKFQAAAFFYCATSIDGTDYNQTSVLWSRMMKTKNRFLLRKNTAYKPNRRFSSEWYATCVSRHKVTQSNVSSSRVDAIFSFNS